MKKNSTYIYLKGVVYSNLYR